MLKRLLPSLLLMLLSSAAFAQISIEPIVGFQKDLNNKKIYFINTGLRMAVKTSPGNEFLVQTQVSFPFSYHPKADSAFTSNTALPLYTPANKTVNIHSYSFAVGDRFHIAGWHTKGKFFAHVFIGIVHQSLDVSYVYDKTNDILLNPDKTQTTTSMFVSAGITYLYPLGPGRFLTELNLSSPPFVGANKYPYQTRLISPVSFNIGYSIQLSKKKNEK